MNDVMLPPAERCARCERTLGEAGGRRVVCTSLRGFRLSRTPVAEARGRSVEIAPDLHLLAFPRSGETALSDEATERAERDARLGQHPWLCQRCAHRMCERCGAPLAIVQGSDLLEDDGSVTHQMTVPSSRICSNAACEDAMPTFED